MPDAPNPLLFDAVLRPHRSLDLSGVRLVALLAAALALIPGITFFAMGAWPVVGLLGLDVAILYWALTRSLDDGRASETVRLWRDSLAITHQPARGAERAHRFNPFHVRFRAERDHDDRVTDLVLLARAERLSFGRFLPPDAKAAFARDFSAALHRAKT